MRRVKIVSAKTSSPSVEDLRLKYQAFKKENPGAQARVPHEIKKLARTIIESDSTTVNALAKDIGLSPTSVRSWLKTLSKASKVSRNRTTPLESGKAARPNTGGPVDDVGIEIKKELARISNLLQPDSEDRKRLAELTRLLIDLGLGIDRIASLTGVHALTVRSWLKTPQPKAAAVGPKKAFPEVATPEAQQPIVSLPLPSAALLEPASSPGNWVRIRVSGHMMEIDWMDLVQKLPAVDRNEAAVEVELTKPAEGQMDFNLAVAQDHDFIKVMDQFEKSIIKAAMERHRSIAKCCEALKLPRSTFDAKRRKHRLI